MRALLKVWQSDRPLKIDSRRAKFYKPGDSGESWRIEFMDEYGEVNWFAPTRDEAERKYQSFKDGEFSTLDIRDEKGE